jgi:hypothetical protein
MGGSVMIKRVLLLAMLAGAAYGVPFRFNPMAKPFDNTWTPRDLPNLAWWLDASDESTIFQDVDGTVAVTNGALVGLWKDKSGDGRDVLNEQSPSRIEFATNAKNGLPVVRVKTANGYLAANLALRELTRDRAAVSIAALYFNPNPTGAPTVQTLVFIPYSSNLNRFSLFSRVENQRRASFRRLNTDSPFGLNFPQTTSDSLLVAVANYQGNLASFFVDGDPTPETRTFPSGAGNSDNSTAATTTSIFGRTANDSMPVGSEIYEIIATLSALTNRDRQKLEGYLAHKWGTTAILPESHPYKELPPTK